MKFSTAGSMGDSIYQTLFMLEASEAVNAKLDFIHLQTNKKCSYYKAHPYGDVGLTRAAADFLAPLFEEQGWHTTIGDNVPSDALNVDLFRELRLNFSCGEIRTWAYQLAGMQLPMDLSRQTLTRFVPDASFSDKIILCKTDRYVNAFIDFNMLKPLQKKLVFLGLQKEHEDFCRDFFSVDYERCEDAKRMLDVMAGSQAVIANPCGPYALAEMAKLKRCLITPEFMLLDDKHITIGPVNVIPQGGDFMMCGTLSRLMTWVDQMK